MAVPGSRTLFNVSEGFGRSLWESFKSAWSAVVGLVALVLSVAVWIWAPDARVSLGLVIPVGTVVLVVSLVAVLTLIEATLRTRDRVEEAEKDRDLIRAEYADYKAASGLPEVVEGREPFTGTQGELEAARTTVPTGPLAGVRLNVFPV